MKDNDSHLIPKHILRQPKTMAPLSVSQLNRAAKQLLESEFLQVYVEGEISNFSRPSSGHWYFSLKDDNAQIRCAFFKGRNLYCQQRVGNGVKVAARGKISLFEARGEYQMIIESLEEAGIGALQARFEALKKQLHNEGLFDPLNKQLLPTQPHRVAVITSPTGAAIRDMLSVFGRRYARLQIDIIPVQVQGDQAAPQIVAALEWVSQLGMHDAVVLARGGGSIEDLWAFNEERVARSIHNCPLPVISAIGHETDFTIADFVADQRAPTPSAAAEILSPDSSQQVAKLSQLERRLLAASRRNLQDKKQQLLVTRRALKQPNAYVQQQNQRVDDLESRLSKAFARTNQQRHKDLLQWQQRLQFLSPIRQLHDAKKRLNIIDQQVTQLINHRLAEHRKNCTSIKQQLNSCMENQLQRARQHLGHQSQLLNNLSPLNVVQRGYSLTRNEKHHLINSVHQTDIGSKIDVQLRDGSLTATVTSVEPKHDH